MSAEPIAGFAKIETEHAVDDAVRRITELLQARGVTLFAVVDHSGEAQKAGLTMRPTKLVIFGSPKAGTPVMVDAPSAAIDLPLKLLVWDDESGRRWIGYNTAAYLQERHHFSETLEANLAAAEILAKQAAETT